MASRKKSTPGIEGSETQRSQYWACVLYEESCSPSWKEELEQLRVPAFAIEHNKDLSAAEDGTPKKAHIHVMLMYTSLKSQTQVLDDLKGVQPANGQVQRVKDRRSYGRYLTHLDNPDKHQYRTDEVLCFGGADYANFIASSADRTDLVAKNAHTIQLLVERLHPADFDSLASLLWVFNRELYSFAIPTDRRFVMEFICGQNQDPDIVQRHYKDVRGEIVDRETGAIVLSPFDEHGEFIDDYIEVQFKAQPLDDCPFDLEDGESDEQASSSSLQAPSEDAPSDD